MNKLNPVEALRAQILIDNAVKKLSFLSNLGGGERDELTQFMGDEISRIIKEQRLLEKQYEALIHKRGTLKGLMNKGEFQKVQQKIVEVSAALRESNQALCRNLKENPNAQGNLVKMLQERARIHTLLEDAKKELQKPVGEQGFAGLVSKAELERKDQELLFEVKRREKEVSLAVKSLEQELAQEYAEYDKEVKFTMQELRTLKEELQKNKAESRILLNTEEKKLKAQEQGLARMLGQKEVALANEATELERTKRDEQLAHDKSHDFLAKKLEDLTAQRVEWAEKYDKDTAEKQEVLARIREESHSCRTRLFELRERQGAEEEKKAAIEKEQRFLLQVEKWRSGQEIDMAKGILFLQSEGRAYIARVAAANANKKGKKGKKGKKK
mmetsp:Transcript_6798/g.16622  ORF Transcript_6798/g.16622 Transcript_6798/m.16622 type:complete len:385 (-) Transcript_6798:274-1428(-)|eukprot:g7430.t1